MISIFTPCAKKLCNKELGILGFVRGKFRSSIYLCNKINIFWKGCPYFPKPGEKDTELNRN